MPKIIVVRPITKTNFVALYVVPENIEIEDRQVSRPFKGGIDNNYKSITYELKSLL